MKLLSIAVLLNLIVLAAFAQQNHQVKGTVTDTASNAKLYYASISILNAKDSTLYKFTRANEDGHFTFNNVRPGKFILLLTYPDYADFVSSFSLDSTKTVMDFKQIDMKSKARVLKEVLIKGNNAITIKGDTTEFNASSYSIQPNDKVEDLLKKLPGIQVDKDGKITAQGKSIPKVLVDGEEFFGDDPTLVTKNLRADMVDKVQLFDKTSDQAAFTGVDDGNKTPTINIKLKENMKKGYFGKVDAGYGTKDFYQGQAMFNYFKAKQKFSVYGTSSNNGLSGLNWDDAAKYGSGTIQFEEDYAYSTGRDEGFDGTYWGEGLPQSNNAGVHYDTKWNEDKETLNTNYKLGSFRVKTNKNTITQNTLPTGIINSNADDVSDKNVFRQKVDATYTIKLDTTSNLKVSIDGTLKNDVVETDFYSSGVRGDGTQLNTSKRTLNSNGSDQLFNISAFYNKKLKKLGRNYSITLSQRVNQKENDGFLFSNNSFFDNTGVQNGSEVVDQNKVNNTKISVFNANATYNEPLTKSASILFNYGFSLNNSRADRRSYNRAANGNYDILDLEFSNDFETTQYANQGGAIFSYKKPKTILNFGTKINAVRFDQYEAISNQRYDRSFINWLPQLSYQYKFSQQKSLRFNYNGSTRQPTVSQLQPVRVNDDPLNQPLGNPDLKPSFSNSFYLNYNTYKMLTSQNFYVNANFSFTNNQIVSNTNTDAQGRSVFQSVNIKDKTPYFYNLYGGFSRKIKFLFGLEGGIRLSTYGNTNYNYVNGNLNESRNTIYSPRLSISKYNDKFELYLSYGPSYNNQVSSLQPALNNEGWGRSGYGSFRIRLPMKFSILGDAEYNYTPQSATFSESFEQLIINSSISKSFFKKEQLKFMLRANDLLNQNRGFSRYANTNLITQTSYNNINRYYMLSLIWDFSKMGGAAATK